MEKRKIYRTDFLFTNSNFFIGFGTVLNIAGNYFDFNYSDSDLEADRKALEADWGLVGKDFKEVN